MSLMTWANPRHLVGDGVLRRGDVAVVIDAAKGAGVERVGIVTPAMRGLP
jgi:biopolymer transport protein ExbD